MRDAYSHSRPLIRINKSVSKSIIIKWENAKVKKSLKSNLKKKDIPY